MSATGNTDLDVSDPVLAAVLAVPIAALERACTSGNMAAADNLLRGLLPQGGPATRRTPSAASSMTWSRLSRLTREGEHLQLTDRVVLAGLHRQAERFSVAVQSSSDREHLVEFGFDTPVGLSWAQGLWAPQVSLEQLDSRTAAAAAAEPTHSRSIRFRVAGGGDGPEAVAPVGLLERLLSVPGDWLVTLECHPLLYEQCVAPLHQLTALGTQAARHSSYSEALGEVRSVDVHDPAAARVVRNLEVLCEDLAKARESGAWLVDIQLGASGPDVLDVLQAALTSEGPSLSGKASRTWVTDSAWTAAGPGSPHASLFTTDQLAAFLLVPPSAARGSLAVGAPLPTGRAALTHLRPLTVGTWLGTDEAAQIDVDDLQGHGFIGGTTGSGKSNTLHRLITNASNAYGIPFLIIDPVKGPSEYEDLAKVINGGLMVVSGSQLRMNVLEPAAGTDPGTHLGLVANAFKGAFSMPSPVPYVVSLLMDHALGLKEPTLHHLRRALGPLVTGLGYRGELEANIRASLGTRLSVLCSPRRAERLCSTDSTQISTLLSRPSVVCLGDLGDDEERAFAMAMLTVYVAETARARGPRRQVEHITVVEEAHRLVGEPSTVSSSEDSGDAAGYAARLVTQLLAEIRSAGEAVVIVDQSPAAVAREVVRNTNLKIVHRLLDPADRELSGATMGLEPIQTRFLTQLGRGQAVLYSSRLPGPQMVQVGQAPRATLTAGVSNRLTPPPRERACCGGEHEAHHRSEEIGEQAASILGEVVARAYTHPSSAATPGDVAYRIGQLAERRSGDRSLCLIHIGAQLVATTWRQQRLLDEAGAAQLQRAVEAGFGPLGRGLRRDDLPTSTLPASKPWEGCSACEHPCLVRSVASQHPDLGRIRDDLSRTAPGEARTVLMHWAQRLEGQFANTVGPAGHDATRCVLLHAVGDDPDLAAPESQP